MCTCPRLLHVFSVVAALLINAYPCCGYAVIPLSNADMTDFTSGVATDWTAFATGTDIPAALDFFPDPRNFYDAPCSQGINGIDIPGPPGAVFGAGLSRVIPASAGKVYMFVGFQDVFDPLYAPPPGRRCAHFYGIGTLGTAAPPQPFTMGDVSWMGPGQWLFNDRLGSSTQLGGMHKCTAAYPARSSQISLWTGAFVYADGPVSTNSTTFDIDSHSVFEFDNPALPQLENPGFENVDVLTPELGPDDFHRITLPQSWVPMGGGIGQYDSYYTDYRSARGGTCGFRIYNRRGCLTRGLAQRVAAPLGALDATFSAWVRANISAGTTAAIGIDPAGGDDIGSSRIAWTYYNEPGEGWANLSVSAPCTGPAVTVFLLVHNQGVTSGDIFYGDFDDCSLNFNADPTPPEPFDVVSPSPATLLTFLSACIVPEPTDPETGIDSVKYAVGTAPEAEDVRPYTECADRSLVLAPDLELTAGQTYFVSVRATNGAGLATTSVSPPILCQPRPYPYSWSEVRHLSQTAYSADNPRMAAAASGELCVVWRESDDLTWSGDDSRIVFRRRIGGDWSAPVKVNAAANAWWPDVAVAPSGAAVSYATPGDPLSNELHVALQSGAGAFTDTVAAASVSAFPRVAWGGLLAVGCNRNPTADPSAGEPSLVVEKQTWTVEPLPGAANSGADMRVRVAAGSRVHCLWAAVGPGGPAVYYCFRDQSGTFSPPRMIAAGASSGDIAVALGGEVSVVYTKAGVWYTHSPDGVAFDIPEYLGRGVHPRVSIGPDGRVHVLFFAGLGMVNENGVPLVAPTHLVKDALGWSMPQPVCAPSCTSGVPAQEPGAVSADPSGVLHFVWSNNPHDRGMQPDGFEGYYWIDYYTTAPLQSSIGDIASAKLWGDDAAAAELGYPPSKTVELKAKQVTAVGAFPFAGPAGAADPVGSVPCFYVQDSDRSSGIRVIAGDAQDSAQPPVPVVPGDLVTVSGVISTINGERTLGYLTSDGLSRGVTVTKTGHSSAPAKPLCMRVGNLGGSSLGPTPGVTGGHGPNNIGLLVRIAGRVVSVGYDARGVKVLYIDDGSGVPCGGSTGCKVYAPGSAAAVGDFAVVTGASSVELYDPTPDFPGDESYIRVILPQDALAVTQLAGLQ